MPTRSMTSTRLVLALAAAGVLGGAGATFVSNNHARAAAPAGARTSNWRLSVALFGASLCREFSRIGGIVLITRRAPARRSVAPA